MEIDRVSTGKLLWVTTRFEHHDSVTRLSQSRCHSAAASARTYHDVLTIGGRLAVHLLFLCQKFWPNMLMRQSIDEGWR